MNRTDLGTGPLSVTQPVPAALALPPDYDRHRPAIDAQRAVLHELGAQQTWAKRSWSELVEDLIAVGRTDIPLARLTEGHVDALRILDQARSDARPGALYGVWASRSQQTGVTARPVADGLQLDGELRFASGAGLLDRALVPVWLDADTSVLLDLEVTGLPVDASAWRTSAMSASRSHTVRFAAVRVGAESVGSTGFYLDRAGFFPGGVGVAACWVGGAARVVDLLWTRHPTPTPPQRVRLGRIRTDLVSALAAVRGAADQLDRLGLDATVAAAPPEPGTDWQALATEARAAAAEAVRRILVEARLVTGPAGLAMDDGLGHAVSDLELYVLQQNSDADAGLLGDPGRQP